MSLVQLKVWPAPTAVQPALTAAPLGAGVLDTHTRSTCFKYPSLALTGQWQLPWHSGSPARCREHLTHPGRNYGEPQQAQQTQQTQQGRPAAALVHPSQPQPLSASPPTSPRVHEYRALPGDVHIPLVAKAVRCALR